MPRSARVDVGGEIYHVINRANGRMQIFNTPGEYQLFESLMSDTLDIVDMRILAYVIMPNHWHLVLYPYHDGDLGTFMHRLSNAHTRQVHALTDTNGAGHLYQGRYKSFLVGTDDYLLALIRYVERNPVRAGLIDSCESWRWGSAYKRSTATPVKRSLLADLPVVLPENYMEWVNTPDKENDLAAIRSSVKKGVPYGRDSWVSQMVTQHGLESTLRNPGRPKIRP